MKCLIAILLTATLFVSNGCVFRNPLVPVTINIPSRPELRRCPEKPEIEGTVRGDTVVLPMMDAVELRKWIEAYQNCTQINEAVLKGHLEKLENRLRALEN